MRRAVLVLAGLAAAAPVVATPRTAYSQTVADRADARCILLLNVMGAQAGKDVNRRGQASEGVFFYLGRLSAHGQAGKLGAILTAEAATITSQQQAQAELSRCGNELNARAADLRNGLTQLQAAGRAKAVGGPAPAGAAPPAAPQ